MMSAQRYAFDNVRPEQGERLRALEAVFDEVTITRLGARGVGPGWRCLEIGAGGGSIASWLCRRVEHSGLAWLPEPLAVLRCIVAALKPGGWLLAEELEALLRDGGEARRGSGPTPNVDVLKHRESRRNAPGAAPQPRHPGASPPGARHREHSKSSRPSLASAHDPGRSRDS
jgi:hypothetical protein